jgi:LAO/AO transport system kinase
MARAAPDVPELVALARAGQPRAVGRLLSLVEDDSPSLRETMAALAPHCGQAHFVGVTGAPGVGKSTATAALVTVLRAAGRRVAVLAVDPSSPFSGGAFLGDRVRMSEHVTDPGVFIRSMASRGHLGGLARSTPQALRVLDAAGFDVILIETVGVGQSEVEVARAADTTVVLVAPGTGDGIQLAKAGILEIGDVYVVNKSDREGSAALQRELSSMLALAERPPGSWEPPVLAATATLGEGIPAVLERLGAHLARAKDSGALQQRRLRRARDEVESIALTSLRRRWASAAGGHRLDALAVHVLSGQLDPYAAAEELVGS